MARYPLGQPLYVSWTVKDRTGTLVDAGANSLVVTKPDASTQTYGAPTHDGTGLYHQDIPVADLPQLGHYQWVNTSTGTGAGVARGEFDIFDTAEPDIFPLQDAKDAVNIAQATTTYDTELQVYLDTITASLESITGGPAYNRAITERVKVSGGYRSLAVRQRPLVSVTSITDIASGAAVSLADLDIDTSSGIIRRKLGLPFWAWGPYYTVVYVAGWGTAIPPAFNLAARFILRHLWETERGPGLAPVPDQDVTFLPGMSFAIPNRALEVLRPYALEAYF